MRFQMPRWQVDDEAFATTRADALKFGRQQLEVPVPEKARRWIELDKRPM